MGSYYSCSSPLLFGEAIRVNRFKLIRCDKEVIKDKKLNPIYYLTSDNVTEYKAPGDIIYIVELKDTVRLISRKHKSELIIKTDKDYKYWSNLGITRMVSLRYGELYGVRLKNNTYDTKTIVVKKRFNKARQLSKYDVNYIELSDSRFIFTRIYNFIASKIRYVLLCSMITSFAFALMLIYSAIYNIVG